MNLSAKNEEKKDKRTKMFMEELKLKNNYLTIHVSFACLPSFPIPDITHSSPSLCMLYYTYITFVTYIHPRLRAEYDIEHVFFFFLSETV